MKKLRNLLTCVAAITAAAMTLGGCSKPAEAPTTPENTETASSEPFSIGILQLVEHEALDASRTGFLDALAEEGYKDGENISVNFQNAQNDQSNLKTMSQKFVNDNVDLILAIATPAAQSVATETTTIPILGTAITDYVEAGLVESNENPTTNVSGTSDRTPVEEQFQLMMKLLPDTKKVGIMYNSSEPNSEIQAKVAMKVAEELGLTYEIGTVTNINDIPQAVQSLVTKVDAFYIPTDNTFASAMVNLTAITNDAKIPVIVGESGPCKNGGLATTGIDYYKLGYQTGKMAVRIIQGEDISTMPIEYAESNDICINLDAANILGIEIPQDVLDSASIIIQDGKVTQK